MAKVYTIGRKCTENAGQGGMYDVVRIGKVYGGFHPVFMRREAAEAYMSTLKECGICIVDLELVE